jgi:ABC-type branched-subunit amino acid transport system ATPase component
VCRHAFESGDVRSRNRDDKFAMNRHEFWRPAERIARLRQPARWLLQDVGLGPNGETVASRMSHWQHRQLEIEMALATNQVMLLLDEPMAGLGIEQSRAMSKLLARIKGHDTILLIEHDMDVVFSLADRVSVLVGGRIVACNVAVFQTVFCTSVVVRADLPGPGKPKVAIRPGRGHRWFPLGRFRA